MSVGQDMDRLLADAGIVRHRGKIEATLNNARRAQEMRDRGVDLVRYFWSFAADTRPGDGIVSPASAAMSKDLKKNGWKFVGPTTVYSFMQSMGMVNDHAADCGAHAACAAERDAVMARFTNAC